MSGQNGSTDYPVPLEKDGHRYLRLFVAIELPEFIKDALSRLQAETRKTDIQARWTKAGNIHLTLKFLGDTPVSRLDEIERALAAAVAGVSSISLRASGLSVFPGVKRARVLWTGVSGDTDKLAILQQQVEAHLSTIGFEKEERRFAAHLTLARFKGRVNPETLVSVITRCGDFVTDSFIADSLCLFESRLTPKGAVYNCLQSHPFTVGKK